MVALLQPGCGAAQKLSEKCKCWQFREINCLEKMNQNQLATTVKARLLLFWAFPDGSNIVPFQ